MIVESQIDDLDIGWCDLRSVSVSVIKQLVMMKRLEIYGGELTKDQRVVLFNSIRQSPQLKHLTLDWSHLVDDPATVANSLSKLESVMLHCAPHTLLTKLAEKIQSGSSNLKELRLRGFVSEEVEKIFQESLKFIQEF